MIVSERYPPSCARSSQFAICPLNGSAESGFPPPADCALPKPPVELAPVTPKPPLPASEASDRKAVG